MNSKRILIATTLLAFNTFAYAVANEASLSASDYSQMIEQQAKVTAVQIFPVEKTPKTEEDSIKVSAQSSTVVKKEKTEPKATASNEAPIKLLKRVAIDKDCDGIADEDYSKTKVSPGNGQCLSWSLTVENSSDDTFCNVEVKDSAPKDISGLDVQPFIIEQPKPGAGSCEVDGQFFTCSVGNPVDMDGDGKKEEACLKSKEKAEIRYSVRLNDLPGKTEVKTEAEAKAEEE
jgi:hypothetical protein